MRKLLFFIIIWILCFSGDAWATIYYADPAGTGSTCSVGSPGTVVDCINILVPGDTLYLNDGTYTGADYMIDFGSASNHGNIDGSDGSPITIKALNDGMVTIDGGDTNRPIRVGQGGGGANDWIVIEGFNAHSSSSEVVQVIYSSNVSIKRVVAWDAKNPGNNTVFFTNDGTNVLFEDCAGWGTGRKIFGLYQGTDTTFRRCFGRFTKHNSETIPAVKETFTLNYYSDGSIIENCIGTWDEISGSDQPNAYAIMSTDQNSTGDSFKLLGSIFYSLDSQTATTTLNYIVELGLGYGYHDFDTLEIKDVLAYTDRGSYIATFFIDPSDTVVTASYLTSFGGSGYQAADDFSVNFITAGQGWSGSIAGGTVNHSIVQGADNYGVSVGDDYDYIAFYDNTSGNWESGSAPSNNTTSNPDLVGNCGNIFQYDCTTNRPEVASQDVGAKIQYRYVDGVLTGDELWPWPMNDRIAAALVASGYDTKGLDGSGSTDLTDVIFTLGGGTNPFDDVVTPPNVSVSGITFGN